MSLATQDAGVDLEPDPARLVASIFLPGESTPGSTSRTVNVTERVLRMSSDELAAAARRLLEGSDPIPGRAALFRTNAALVVSDAVDELSDDARIVLGAAFTAEFAVEGAALCNPSAVPHPDQSGLEAGELRLVLSLRSIGEGHVSSITFCEAILGPERSWRFVDRALPLVPAAIADGEWQVAHLQHALEHAGQLSELGRAVIRKLPSQFVTSDIERAIRALPTEFLTRHDSREQLEAIRVAGRSAYLAHFPEESALSARVLLSAADEERQGMEDARFVLIETPDGEPEYRATYTAYDGRSIASRLLITRDFASFSVQRLTGAGARTKGMALFPRRIGDDWFALTRSNGERISISRSRDGLEWVDDVPVYTPERLWEIVQSGNCGSPIETDRGWLVLTHGVGPLRHYGIGAILLDLDDPRRVIGVLDDPLLEPTGDQRFGYVPNVVYTCGGVVHDGVLWIPYGIGDQHIRVASVSLDALLDAMTPGTETGQCSRDATL